MLAELTARRLVEVIDWQRWKRQWRQRCYFGSCYFHTHLLFHLHLGNECAPHPIISWQNIRRAHGWKADVIKTWGSIKQVMWCDVVSDQGTEDFNFKCHKSEWWDAKTVCLINSVTKWSDGRENEEFALALDRVRYIDKQIAFIGQCDARPFDNELEEWKDH